MHELSITRSVVAIVTERAAGARVTRVRLEVGRLSAMMPEAIRFCFDLCAQGTQGPGHLERTINLRLCFGICERCRQRGPSRSHEERRPVRQRQVAVDLFG